MMFHLKEAEGGISFSHVSGIDSLRATWVVIHVLSSLAMYAKKIVASCPHHQVGSKKVNLVFQIAS